MYSAPSFAFLKTNIPVLLLFRLDIIDLVDWMQKAKLLTLVVVVIVVVTGYSAKLTDLQQSSS